MIVFDIIKNGKKCVIFFSNIIIKFLLEKVYEKYGYILDYILWNYIKDERCLVDIVDYCMDKIKRNVKVRKLFFYMIRKFFVSDMYNKFDGDVLMV